jgi:hypothetical protein
MNEYLKQLLTGNRPQIPFRPEEEIDMTGLSPMQQNPIVPENMEQDITEEDVLQAQNEMIQPSESPIIPQPLEAPTVPQIAPEATPLVNPREAMLNQLRELREGNKASLEAARASDDKVNLMSNLNKAFADTGASIANRAGITKIKADPLAVKGSAEERTTTDNKADISALMEEYRSLSQGEQQQFERDYKNKMLELEKEKLALQDKKVDKAAVKPQRDMVEEFRAKEGIKEDSQIKKENRKIRQTMDEAIPGLDTQISNIDKAIEVLEKNLSVGGPIMGRFPAISKDRQLVEQALNSVSLNTMVNMFAGMSKAIDSDAERAFFQSSQPDIKKDADVNIKVLQDMKKAAESLKNKTKKAIQSYDSRGDQSFEQDSQPEKSQDSVQVGNKNVPVGSVITAKGKRYRVVDASGKLEEL